MSSAYTWKLVDDVAKGKHIRSEADECNPSLLDDGGEQKNDVIHKTCYLTSYSTLSRKRERTALHPDEAMSSLALIHAATKSESAAPLAVLLKAPHIPVLQHKFRLSGITIAEFHTINTLAISIDQKLNWNSHVKTVATRAASEKPCFDSQRAEKWPMSLASVLLFALLLSDYFCSCAGTKLRSGEAAGGSSRLWSQSAGARHLASGQSQGKARCDLSLSNLSEPLDDLETACSFPQGLDSACLWSYFSHLRLSFCQSYTIADLLREYANPNGLNCSLDMRISDDGGAMSVCSKCIRAYQMEDQHAQEKYEEFEAMLHKHLERGYSVRSCPSDCMAVYKAWLCSEYFKVTQLLCPRRIPCKQYCLEVQARCPFILPDNEDLIYGGLPSFICTGLLENHLTNAEPECCDVRWNTCDLSWDRGYNVSTKSMDSMLHHKSSLPVSAASRLCNSRLKLCVLVLILLHTVVTFTGFQNNGRVGMETVSALDDSSASEE
ncbi:NALCN channel auxiliary factor 2-like [Mustelus asterias]